MFLTPLDPKAVSQIRVNGKKLTDMSEVRLCPNDRLCIGPSSYFIYKNRQHDEEQSMPDTDENPITLEFASEEVLQADHEEETKKMDDIKKAHEELAKKQMAELQERLKREE